jgi:hypothetical protein
MDKLLNINKREMEGGGGPWRMCPFSLYGLKLSLGKFKP